MCCMKQFRRLYALETHFGRLSTYLTNSLKYISVHKFDHILLFCLKCQLVYFDHQNLNDEIINCQIKSVRFYFMIWWHKMLFFCSVGKRSGHIPYRDSKLTRILQHSLGGNARTAIICTLSPASSHVEQSRNTLFFATRAKEVTNNAQVNMVRILFTPIPFTSFWQEATHRNVSFYANLLF